MHSPLGAAISAALAEDGRVATAAVAEAARVDFKKSRRLSLFMGHEGPAWREGLMIRKKPLQSSLGCVRNPALRDEAGHEPRRRDIKGGIRRAASIRGQRYRGDAPVGKPA